MKHLGDIRNIKGNEIPVVDCICGGSPCQDLSIASSNRSGLSGERSGLFIEQIRVVREMRENDRQTNGHMGMDVKPRFMVWENVPGALSSGSPKGEDFRIVLEEIAKIADKDASIPRFDKGWRSAGCILGRGWSIAWRIHDAQFWGVPQRRKRIALVADFGSESAPEVLFERKGMSWNNSQSREKWEETSRYIADSVDETGKVWRKKGHPMNKEMSQLWEKTDVVDTLNTYDNTDVRASTIILNACTVGNGQSNQSFGSKKVGALSTMHDQQAIMVTSSIASNMTVRRLTPLECERLQGFPDNWTNIPDYKDTKGRRRKTSDSARFTALGNSIAIPFWFWLLRRISSQYVGNATLGSLFDGIGGFPYCWERCNGKGSAVWASEIEEFPIAVTKYHFPEEERGDPDDNAN